MIKTITLWAIALLFFIGFTTEVFAVEDKHIVIMAIRDILEDEEITYDYKFPIEEKKLKCIDLDYLMHRTKSDPILMMEMISLYLEQTPSLIKTMKQSLLEKDWK